MPLRFIEIQLVAFLTERGQLISRCFQPLRSARLTHLCPSLSLYNAAQRYGTDVGFLVYIRKRTNKCFLSGHEQVNVDAWQSALEKLNRTYSRSVGSATNLRTSVKYNKNRHLLTSQCENAQPQRNS